METPPPFRQFILLLLSLQHETHLPNEFFRGFCLNSSYLKMSLTFPVRAAIAVSHSDK